MDGTSKSYIATTEIPFPKGLTIDYSCKSPNIASIHIIKNKCFHMYISHLYFLSCLQTLLGFSKPFVLD